MEKLSHSASIVAVLLVAGVLGYIGADKLPYVTRSHAPATVRLPDFVSVAQRFGPSLVHIVTSKSADEQNRGATTVASEILGSGIIVSRDGDILTSNHVVDGAAKITIRFADRRELIAAVRARDLPSDMALLKVVAPVRLIPARFADSSGLEPGQWVLALGSPFGLDRTVTAGIISGKARRIPGSIYNEYIQTDISINPGNSGGPLLDLDGGVVGINTAVINRNGENTGISFALPSNRLKALLAQMVATGSVRRGWLGISAHQQRETVRSPGSLSAVGALVIRVEPHSPAAQAGIRPGDVIVGYDGSAVVDVGMLAPAIATSPIGRTVALAIQRGPLLYKARLAIGELQHGAAPNERATLPIDQRFASAPMITF